MEYQICFYCLDLFPVYDAINEGKIKLVPAGETCSFCAYLEEHRSPFVSELAEVEEVTSV